MLLEVEIQKRRKYTKEEIEDLIEQRTLNAPVAFSGLLGNDACMCTTFNVLSYCEEQG